MEWQVYGKTWWNIQILLRQILFRHYSVCAIIFLLGFNCKHIVGKINLLFQGWCQGLLVLIWQILRASSTSSLGNKINKHESNISGKALFFQHDDKSDTFETIFKTRNFLSGLQLIEKPGGLVFHLMLCDEIVNSFFVCLLVKVRRWWVTKAWSSLERFQLSPRLLLTKRVVSICISSKKTGLFYPVVMLLDDWIVKTSAIMLCSLFDLMLPPLNDSMAL